MYNDIPYSILTSIHTFLSGLLVSHLLIIKRSTFCILKLLSKVCYVTLFSLPRSNTSVHAETGPRSPAAVYHKKMDTEEAGVYCG